MPCFVQEQGGREEEHTSEDPFLSHGHFMLITLVSFQLVLLESADIYVKQVLFPYTVKHYPVQCYYLSEFPLSVL